MDRVAPKYSIVVPVLYEQDTIGGLLDHIETIDGFARCQLIIVDGDPEGGTIGKIANDRVIRLVSPPGRSRQMNAGAAVATGEILIFLHADTCFPRGALDEIERVLARGAVAGAFRLCFDSDRFVYRLMSFFVTLRSRWNRLPYGDQAIFIRRDFFEKIGGYKDIPIMEDVDIVRRIRRAGGNLQILDSAVRTSNRRLEAEGITRRVLKNWMMMILYNLGVSPLKLARFYSEEYRRAEQTAPDATSGGPGDKP
jgi:rSAM/selenodomain-associated transferase 2